MSLQLNIVATNSGLCCPEAQGAGKEGLESNGEFGRLLVSILGGTEMLPEQAKTKLVNNQLVETESLGDQECETEDLELTLLAHMMPHALQHQPVETVSETEDTLPIMPRDVSVSAPTERDNIVSQDEQSLPFVSPSSSYGGTLSEHSPVHYVSGQETDEGTAIPAGMIGVDISNPNELDLPERLLLGLQEKEALHLTLDADEGVTVPVGMTRADIGDHLELDMRETSFLEGRVEAPYLTLDADEGTTIPAGMTRADIGDHLELDMRETSFLEGRVGALHLTPDADEGTTTSAGTTGADIGSPVEVNMRERSLLASKLEAISLSPDTNEGTDEAKEVAKQMLSSEESSGNYISEDKPSETSYLTPTVGAKEDTSHITLMTVKAYLQRKPRDVNRRPGYMSVRTAGVRQTKDISTLPSSITDSSLTQTSEEWSNLPSNRHIAFHRYTAPPVRTSVSKISSSNRGIYAALSNTVANDNKSTENSDGNDGRNHVSFAEQIGQQLSTTNTQNAQDIISQLEHSHRFISVDDVESLVKDVVLAADSEKRNHEITLRLYPRTLGELQITVKCDDEQLVAELVATTKEALALLEEHLPELRNGLNQEGINLENLSLGMMNHGDEQGSSWKMFEEHKRNTKAISKRNASVESVSEVDKPVIGVRVTELASLNILL